MSVKSIVIKAVALLCAVLILVLCAVLLLAPEEKETNDMIEVFTLDERLVDKICIKGEEEYCLYKADTRWEMEGYEGIGVNATYANTLVKSMCNITSPMKAADNAENLADYGLMSPQVEVELYTENEVKRIFIGNASGEQHYLKLEDAAAVYVVNNADLHMVLMDKIKYLDNTVIQIDTDAIEKISFGSTYLEKRDGAWYMLSPFECKADDDKVKAYVTDCFDEITCYDIAIADGIKGVKNSDVVLTLSDGKEVVIELWGQYIILSGDRFAYKVKSDEMSFLTLDAFELVFKYVAPIPISEVSELELEWSKGECKFYIDAPASEAPIFYKDDREVSEEKFRSFYQSLMSLCVTKKGEGEGEAEYKLIFTKTNKEKYTVEFISANESEFAVKINGKTNFMITKKAVSDVFAKLNEVE